METLPIENSFYGAPIYFLPETDSTMTVARSISGPGCIEGTVVVSDYQSAGRGRGEGRFWLSEHGKNLLFTLVLAPERVCEPALPLRIGLAVRKTILGMVWPRGSFPVVEIKWPNDILISGKKTAGVLCEATASGVLVGVGINCDQTDYDPEISESATSLALASGTPVNRWKLLTSFLHEMAATLKSGESRREEWRKEVELNLWNRGKSVRFRAGRAGSGESFEAVIYGIEQDGALVLDMPGGGRRICHAGEISLLR